MVQLDDRTFRLYQLCVQGLQLSVVICGFALAIRQFRTQARSHLLSLYQQVFKMIDHIRDDRHYLASSEVDRFTTFGSENTISSPEGQLTLFVKSE
jgi:hypothetical protein